jgi:hypothetical protein
MSNFVLTVFPDGKCLITTEQNIGAADAALILQRFREWQKKPESVAVMANCRVQHAKSVEIELPEADA